MQFVDRVLFVKAVPTTGIAFLFLCKNCASKGMSVNRNTSKV